MIAATILNVTNAFIGYRFIVFKSKGNLIREYFRFYLVYAVPIGLGFIGFPICLELLKMNPYFAQAVLMVITIAISYFGHKYITFVK
jgi:putative flippase GtrA